MARQKRRPTIDDLRATPELWNLEIQQIKDDATIAEQWIICQEADALLDSQITPEAIVELRQKLNVEPVPHPEVTQ